MDVVVVGAGISGLVCAYRLARRGHAVTVLERAPDVGGRMSTVEVDGFRVDTGANLLVANYARLHALAEELDLDGELFNFQSDSGGVLRDHELTSFSPAGLFDVLRYRGLALPSRMRLLRYFMKAYRWRTRLDFYDLSVGDDPDEERDAWSATAAQMGEEVAEYLVDPFIRTFHFHGARLLSMKYFDALAALFLGGDGFTTRGFRGYMIALPRALAARLEVKTCAPVSHVTASGGGVLVDGVRHDAVVLAVPAPIAAGMLMDPSPEQGRLLKETAYSATLCAAFTVPLSVAQDFEGIWVPYSQSRLISECSNETCKGSVRDGHCVFTLGMHHEAAGWWMGRDDRAVFRAFDDEWCRLFPRYAGRMKPLHLQRWPLAMPIYSPGHVPRVRHFWSHGQGHRGIWLCGDYLNHPWIEGSIRCGEKVAARLG